MTEILQSRRLFLCLVSVHWAVILPIFEQIHPLFFVISFLAISWRGGTLWYQWKLPSKLVVNCLSLGGALALVLLARQLGLLATMINLLMFAYALKFIEQRAHRDIYTLILIGFFLIGVSFIFQQGIGMAIYLLLVTLMTFYALFLCHTPETYVPDTTKPMVHQLLAALPLALVLFLVLPRMGPLWKMPDARKSVTGLSEEVSPGDIAELGRSSKLAFRVDFKGRFVARDQLYWRAMTHETFDGRSWQLHPSVKRWREAALRGEAIPQLPNAQGESVRYTVIAEPSYRNWLFGLDNPTSQDRSVLNAPGNTLYARRILSKTKAYNVESVVTGIQSSELSDEQRRRNLLLPDGINPDARAFAEQLRSQFSSIEDLSEAILSRFREQEYFYTLKPPLLGRHSVDEFLFSTRSGFCEHYASAYTFLMRAAGVPARVVTGYLGGEYNPGGDYFAVYQFDAHAWSEIWMEGEGWLRVDPTAAVAPERVLGSLEDALAAPDEFVSGDPFSLVRYRNIGWLTEMRHLMAVIDYRWTVWVLNYSNEQQLSLFRSLFGHLSQLKLVAISLGGFVFGGLILFIVSKISWRPRFTPIEKFRLRTLTKLAKRGVFPLPGEPLTQTLERAAAELQLSHFQQLAKLYESYCYAHLDERNKSKHWQSMKKVLRMI
ncbi:DUF3488 and transglutaminase-like domain-containing protein [Corallincola platygyrae]|uniref:DUF3488 and transglutaminase-like domain-containing protein n=1 Tax=Corallincola platygyrae TaxID=1193278 RepID=A0ABW4XSP3_9GAMM